MPVLRRTQFYLMTRFAQGLLDNRRFLHTLGVVQASVLLADLNGVSLEKAAVAAMLHDCAKPLDSPSLAGLLSGNSEWVEPDDFEFPQVLHAPAGAVLALNQMGVQDQEVLEAIAFHPTGKERPSMLLQVLMAADFTEPTRQYPGVDEARRLVRQDLREGLRWVLNRKIGHVRSGGKKVHPRTLAMLADLGA